MTTTNTGTAPALSSTEERILTVLDEIRTTTSITAVKLFGASDPDEENETGRLAKVEKSANKAHERIDKSNIQINKLERRIALYTGGAAALMFASDLALRVWLKH